jgi:hypothetical protein
MGVCVAGVVVATLVLGAPELAVLDPHLLFWAEVALGALAAVLLALVMPVARRRLLDPERVRRADPAALKSWGVSAEIDPAVARQAVYLTRYTAGCVISWGLSASVALYGLVAGMLGTHPAITGAFLAASVFALLMLPPVESRVRLVLEGLARP